MELIRYGLIVLMPLVGLIAVVWVSYIIGIREFGFRKIGLSIFAIANSTVLVFILLTSGVFKDPVANEIITGISSPKLQWVALYICFMALVAELLTPYHSWQLVREWQKTSGKGENK